MKRFLAKRWVVPAAALILTLSIGSAAFAVSGSSTDTSTAAGPSATENRGGQRSDETLLTGDALSKVTAAALAKVGSDATVDRAETDADGNAKYEAHVTKADGSHVTVYLDDSFAVVSVEDQPAGGPGHGGRGGGQRSDETLLTGDALSKVTAAALAKVGSDATVDRAETDADGNAKYEAHVTKADGSHVTVYLDDSFAVVSVEDQPAGGPGGGHGGRGGSSDDSTGSTGAGSATGGSGSAATSSL